MMESNKLELEWLIRDNSNVIRGPFLHAEVLQLIKKGQLKGKTEISRANSYWFSMEEKAELARFFPELGIKAPEQPTQMTATLTQAEKTNPGVEITQFTPSPTRKELEGAEEKSPNKTAPKMEWLNEEMAEEFGQDEPSIEMQTNSIIGPMKSDKEGPPQPGLLEPETGLFEKEKKPAIDKIAKEEMMKRASAKADTLPSEHKNYSGERPKPINTLLKGPEKGPSAISNQPSNKVSLSVANMETHAKIVDTQSGSGERPEKSKKGFVLGVIVFLIIAVLAGGAFLTFSSKGNAPVTNKEKKTTESMEGMVKKSLALFSLEGVKEALSDFELDGRGKGNSFYPLSQAIVKKEFLYDTDGAFAALQTARSLASNPRLQNEIDNLMALYRFDREKDLALETFRGLAIAAPREPIFRYNLALGLARVGKAHEASQVVSGLLSSLSRDHILTADLTILGAWSKDMASKGLDPAIEALYLQGLEIDPSSAKARLGLALFRLRRGGLKESEGDFKSFIEYLPDVDSPTKVVNFRKMKDFEFYNFIRSQLRDLNVPQGVVGLKPSPLIMAVDSVLSCMQNRVSEAGKILETALSAAPGELSLMKAAGYHRWKEGRYPEVVDLLKDYSKDKNSFAINILLGKSYLKIGRKDLAEGHFEAITIAHPFRSEGWSLWGQALFDKGQSAQAKVNFDKALSKDSLDLEALRGLDRLGELKTLSASVLESLPF